MAQAEGKARKERGGNRHREKGQSEGGGMVYS